MTTALDGLIQSAADTVGVERACHALGVHPRSYRHRQQVERGQARLRGRAARSVSEAVTASGEVAMVPAIPTSVINAVANPAMLMIPEAAGGEMGSVAFDQVDAAVAVTVVEGSGGRRVAEGCGVGLIEVAVAATLAERRRHPASLSDAERWEVLELLCSDRFVDLSPRQVFMTLLDEGRYYCSVRSMYRLLEDHGLGGERRRGGHQRPGVYPVPVIEASAPNVAWSWDITKLRGPSKGVLYYLYTSHGSTDTCVGSASSG